MSAKSVKNFKDKKTAIRIIHFAYSNESCYEVFKKKNTI